ncbi:MAG: pyruvate kinase [Desulforhopalus sp.]|jgi:pyruvate kinase
MRILLLEDSQAVQLLTKKRMEKDGYEVDAVDNGHQGFQLAAAKSYDIIISDIQMPHWDGFKFIEAMQVICPRLPIIIVSSSENDPIVLERLREQSNVIAVLPKPLNFQTLFELLGKVQIQAHQGVSKQARIVCTIGPASNNVKTLGQMIVAGMDVARLNFSHGTHEQHAKTLIAIREAETFWNRPIAVLQDLCGPKIRTGAMKDGQIQLIAGDTIVIQKDDIIGTRSRISTIVPEIVDDLQIGDPILLDDGLFELKVIKRGTGEVTCEVIVGGKLKSSKGMNLPGTSLSLPSVTEKDWKDLDWALDHSIDYIALSFVRTAVEIRSIKEYIKKSGKRDLRVIAKIEKPEAVNNIKEIIAVSDGIMIARGDMGVELPAPRVPRIQQEIIRLCWQMNTPVITATQMLDSMTTNSRPTRAEVTDVSTAIGEGTDAVMLSQETATGVDPVNVVRTMATIISEEELYAQMDSEQLDSLMEENLSNPVLTAVAGFKNSAATLLLDATGELYPALSKWSRTIPSILVTKSLHVARHATLYKNITPLIIREDLDRDQTVFRGLEMAREIGIIREGDLVSVVEGARLTEGGVDQSGSLQIIVVPKSSPAAST